MKLVSKTAKVLYERKETMNDRNNKMLATISNSLNSHHIKSESKGAKLIELSKQVSL